jgi:hypothetical protein
VVSLLGKDVSSDETAGIRAIIRQLMISSISPKPDCQVYDLIWILLRLISCNGVIHS